MVEKREEENPMRSMKDAERKLKQEKTIKEYKEISNLEREIIKRIKKGERQIKDKQIRKPSLYVKTANKLFSNISLSLYKKQTFDSLKKDLVQANLSFLPVSYISVILFTTLLSAIFAFGILLFFLFFSTSIKFPFITFFSGDLISRFTKIFWILLVIPIATFFITYIYPSVEKNYIKNKINQELPFVAIHMSAIAGSMVEPSKVFEIITMTKEYPYTSKEFTKIINEINIYGYNLVNAIKQTATNTSSYKLSELLNGIITTITSGGSLEKFFEKKSQSLLFDYRLEREKYTRTAETFMDIYISVVIAAPMILMLLLLMIKISGLGIDLTTQTLTLIVVGGVSLVNFIFLTFLYLRQPED